MNGPAVAALIKRGEIPPFLQRLNGLGYMGFGKMPVFYDVCSGIKVRIVVQKEKDVHLGLDQIVLQAYGVDTFLVNDISENMVIDKL